MSSQWTASRGKTLSISTISQRQRRPGDQDTGGAVVEQEISAWFGGYEKTSSWIMYLSRNQFRLDSLDQMLTRSVQRQNRCLRAVEIICARWDVKVPSA